MVPPEEGLDSRVTPAVSAPEGRSLYHGDCLEVLSSFPEESVDAAVEDAPYHLTSIVKRFGKETSAPADPKRGVFARKAAGFMGKDWDGGDLAFQAGTWKARYRVLKPGAYLVVFGHSRTYDLLTAAIREAGFIIRGSLDWIYGTGFPKSLSLVDGRGTALKPGKEPIVLAQRPLRETSYARQVEATGTGALNIEVCRVGDDLAVTRRSPGSGARGIFGRDDREFIRQNPPGRFPSDVLFSHSETCTSEECVGDCPVGELERQSGGTRQSGTAAQYFPVFRYVAKPGRKEREAGTEGLEVQTFNRVNPGGMENDPRWAPAQRRNTHVTVKPVALMRWLVRLVTPPGGIVLDGFMGSGTTGMAACWEGRRFIGVEKDPDYFRIAASRVAWAGCPGEERDALKRATALTESGTSRRRREKVAIETEIKKLREAVEANTAATLALASRLGPGHGVPAAAPAAASAAPAAAPAAPAAAPPPEAPVTSWGAPAPATTPPFPAPPPPPSPADPSAAGPEGPSSEEAFQYMNRLFAADGNDQTRCAQIFQHFAAQFPVNGQPAADITSLGQRGRAALCTEVAKLLGAGQ